MSDAGMQGADGGERRRRTWSADQKQRIIAESFAPGASVAEVARRYGLNSNMLFTWRRRERANVNDVGKTVNIVPVRVVEATPTATATSMGRMEIVLVGASGSLSGRTSTRRRWPGSSRRSSSDDSDPEWGARVASDRPHRYAQRIRRSGADRPRNIEARSAFGPSVRFSRPPRVSDQVSLERRPGLMPVLKAIGARAIPVAIVG